MKPISLSGRVSRATAFSLVVLMSVWVTVLWKAFDSAYSFALYMDNEFFIGTVLSSISSSLHDGELPLRMTTILGGVPLYNFAQLSVLYPFYFTWLPLFLTPVDSINSMHWIALIHILLFSVNTFILLRVIGASRIAAIAGASFVAFGANSLSYAVWVTIVASYAWLPLYLAGIIGVLEDRSSRIFSVMAIGAIVLLALASPSQSLIHAVLLTCLFIFFKLWCNRRNDTSRVTYKVFSKIIIIGVIAFLIAAPAVLPMALDFKEMIRWIGPFPAVIGYGKIPFDAFQIDQLTILELGGVLVRIPAHAVGSQFVGPVALTLAIFAVIARKGSWILIAMATISIYALASAAGSNLGLAYLNYLLPLINKIREPSRFLFLFQLAIGILVALGIDELRRLIAAKNLIFILQGLGILVLIILIINALLAFVFFVDNSAVMPNVIASILLIVLLIVTIFLSQSSLNIRDEIVGMLWAASVVSMLIVNVDWTPPPVTASHYLQNKGIALDKAINRVAQLDPRHDYRVIFEGGIDKQMASMLASYQNVRTLNSYFNPAPNQQFQELYNHGPRPDNYLQVLGAKYLICRDCDESKYHGFNFLETASGYSIYYAKEALPYVQIAQKLDGYFDDLGDFVVKANAHKLYNGLLLVESGTKVTFGMNSLATKGCIVQNDIRRRNQIRYLVSCESPGILVLNEFYARPWHVMVNGINSKVLRVNGNQIGVQLNKGDQMVEFTYRPWIFYLSIALALIGILLMLIFLIRLKQQQR